jgi:outer membrane murein-binding lipoprotein Lpp
MKTAKPFAAVVGTVLIAGCADTPVADADYGSSFEQMIQAQTFDLAAATNPPALAPEMTDAARLENAMDIYRKDVAKGNTEVKQPIIFEVGTH